MGIYDDTWRELRKYVPCYPSIKKLDCWYDRASIEDETTIGRPPGIGNILLNVVIFTLSWRPPAWHLFHGVICSCAFWNWARARMWMTYGLMMLQPTMKDHMGHRTAVLFMMYPGEFTLMARLSVLTHVTTALSERKNKETKEQQFDCVGTHT